MDNMEINATTSDTEVFSSYEAFRQKLSQIERATFAKYTIVMATKDFSKHVTRIDDILRNKNSSKLPSICWEKGDVEYDGIPYIQLGACQYQCHQGQDFNIGNKKKHKLKQEQKIEFVKTKKLSKPSKKVGCPVKFDVKKLLKFDGFNVSENTRYLRTSTTSKLKATLLERMTKGDTQLSQDIGRVIYIVSFPKGGHEFHNSGEAAGIIEPLDPLVSEHLKSLIRSGNRKPRDLQDRAKEYALKEFSNEEEFNPFRRRFFPSEKMVKNMITRVKKELRHSKIDQKNIEMLKEIWQKNADIVFTPRTSGTSVIREVEIEIVTDNGNDQDNDEHNDERFEGDLASNDERTEGKMIFVYQSRKMKRIYRRYAKQLVLLDAMYKTIEYTLPLYFLVVQTNVNYQVAAVIVTQDETTAMIKKALKIVKGWNPDISPKYGMVGYDTAEITALEEVFPGIQIFLCDFHREQSWTRWVNASENNVSNIVDDVKCRLRRIAHSVNQSQIDEAVASLKEWDMFKGKLKTWFKGTWEPVIKHWTLAYRPDDLYHCNTNNGTERLSEDLKYEELNGYANSSLSELLTIIIDTFIPKIYNKYVELNVKSAEGYKGYHASIPSFLYNRPKELVKYAMQKQQSVTQRMINSVKLISTDSKQYAVKSDSTFITDDHDLLDFGDDENPCRCSCPAFRRNRIVCEHFFAVIAARVESFDDVSSIFRNHPLHIIDDTIFEQKLVISSTEEYEQNTHELNTENDIDLPDEPNTPREDDISLPKNADPLLPAARTNFRKRKAELCSNLRILSEQCLNIKQDVLFVDEINEKVLKLTHSLQNHFHEEGDLQPCTKIQKIASDMKINFPQA
ncbi:uncharacterized protein [Clytia hemisphaerica]|uniref:SWIM-type domain-containing protein n=1 Tax=Clytia hemisphaerica TaxID=252671 RepID=A0A7M5V2K3_9CNID